MNLNPLKPMGALARRVTSTQSDAGVLAIEPMRRRHLRAVLDIEEQVHPKPWTSGVFVSEIDLVRAGHRYYAVAFDDSTLVGYGGLMFVDDEAHVTNLAVDPTRRREGFGRRLMMHLIDVAVTEGVSAMTLEVRVSNDAAICLYREFGFAPAGIRQRYYENTEDALVMWAHDVQGGDFARRIDSLRGDRP